MTLFVNCHTAKLHINDLKLSFRLGQNGWTDEEKKREGDKKTPLGTYHLRFGFYRADRLPFPPQNKQRPLNFMPLSPDDGWCDAAGDPLYNRFIKTPFAASHEGLWREDHAYDIILVMSHNDSPPQKDLGSAVFWHIAQSDDRQTLGCLAFTPDDMVRLLPYLQADMPIKISA